VSEAVLDLNVYLLSGSGAGQENAVEIGVNRLICFKLLFTTILSGNKSSF
jgi:hypothetical protein